MASPRSTVGTHILTSMSLSALSLNNGALVVSWSFQAPIETVWSGLTDPVLQSRWLGTAVESDIRPGGRLVIDHGEGASGSDRARRSSLVTTSVSPARQAASASAAQVARGWCRSGRDRRRSARPRHRGRAAHHAERSDLVDRGASGVPDKKNAHGAPPRGWPGRTWGHGRLGHRAVPDPNSTRLQACDSKGPAGRAANGLRSAPCSEALNQA